MDGLDDVLAERQTAFAGGCLGCDEEVKVGPVGTVVVDSGQVGKAGGDADDGADQEDVGIEFIVGLVHYFLKEAREGVANLEREGGKGLVFVSLTSAVSLTSLNGRI